MSKLTMIFLCFLIMGCSIKIEITEHLDKTEKLIEMDFIKYPAEPKGE